MRIRRTSAVLMVVAALLSTAVAVVLPARPARADTMHFLIQLENAYSRKCLDLEQWTDDDGLPAVQRECLPHYFDNSGVYTRQWFHEGANYSVPWPLLYDWFGHYGPKCLEVAAFDTADTALISQHDCNDGPHQNWQFIPSRISGPPALAVLYADAFLIRNEYTGKCLTLAAAQTYNDVAIVQRPCYTAGSLQLWWLHDQGY
ncbi:hypothetical protein [Dactylosporangium sp. NPDC049140]|uniref:RICIN domain-containing protein n=1 Tax=Dactylosporangium sp. NPDC049140 TaxID=3155647 RepID=UPI003402A606